MTIWLDTDSRSDTENNHMLCIIYLLIQQVTIPEATPPRYQSNAVSGRPLTELKADTVNVKAVVFITAGKRVTGESKFHGGKQIYWIATVQTAKTDVLR